MLINGIVSFEQLGPEVWFLAKIRKNITHLNATFTHFLSANILVSVLSVKGNKSNKLKGKAMLVNNVHEMQDLDKLCILMQIWSKPDEK